MAHWLTVIGTVLQFLGAAVVIPGSRSLWRDALFNPTRAIIGRAWRWLSGFLRRLVGKARPQVVQVRGATDVAFGTDSARVTRGFAPLADDMSDAEKIAALERQIRAVVTDTGNFANHMLDRMEAEERRHSDLSRELRAYAGEQAVEDRKRAVRQLQVQALGLFFIAIGSFLQAVGSLLPSDSNPASTGPIASESRPSHANNPAYGSTHSPVAGQATGGLYHPGLPVGAIVAAILN